ncbi:MAG: phosphatidate cytidylyltransferase [Acetatifactor sp.]|nr:phosphatidate cytidylyltransferase [Acetatifactor sp.]
MFVTRLISGIILLVIAISTMSLGNIWLIVPLFLISLVAYRELTKALGCAKKEKGLNSLEIAGFLGIAAYYASAWLVAIEHKSFVLLLACIMYVFMAQMLVYVVTFPKFHANQVVGAFFAFVYAPVMLAFVFLTREMGSGQYTGIGFYAVWLILISSWGCDTCAYAVGVLIGKHKIFPVLSPKKSLEGCIGGVAGAALLGGLYGHFVVERAYIASGNTEAAAAGALALICALGAVMSMVGDLAASAIKRNNNIKDYGKLIPGHGGIMDRFDSMIVTAPMTYFLAVLMLG